MTVYPAAYADPGLTGMPYCSGWWLCTRTPCQPADHPPGNSTWVDTSAYAVIIPACPALAGTWTCLAYAGSSATQCCPWVDHRLSPCDDI